MVSRTTPSPPPPAPSTSTTSAGPDNRLSQAREEQVRQLQSENLAHSREDAERIVDNVMRGMQRRNAGMTESGAQNPNANPRRAPDASAPLRGQNGATLGDVNVPSDPREAQRQAGSNPNNASGTPTTATTRTQDKNAAPNPVSNDLGKMVADFQREKGLPVTGKLDAGTVNRMKDDGVIPRSNDARGGTEAQQRAPAKQEDVAATREKKSAIDQQLRGKIIDDKQVPTREPQQQSSPLDRMADPTRLLASLFAGGFVGKKGSVEEGLKSFQATFGMPITGKLDPKTAEALQQHGVMAMESEAKKSKEADKSAQQQVRRALTEQAPTSKTVADKDVMKDPLRPQAPTNKPTTSNDVAARAFSTQAAEAQEKARLDSVVAQQQATERGVQEGKGDPNAVKGHGELAAQQGQGQKGKGGLEGGGNIPGQGQGGANANVDGPEGDETAVGNANAGDDNFVDEERGHASIKGDDEDGEGGMLPGHYEVPLLSLQVHEALNKIARDDDGNGPVTYTWDVTFYRPGVYGPGQPAEELWHVAVHRATAFDTVWQTAADAIASKMLYAEPEANPPTIDDFILALRRARVR